MKIAMRIAIIATTTINSTSVKARRRRRRLIRNMSGSGEMKLPFASPWQLDVQER
jgi:hypothetical protein